MMAAVEEKQSVPQLRFPGFGGEWKPRKLGELGVFKSGVGFPEREQGGKSGTPFFKVSDMNLAGNEHEMCSSNNYVDEEQIRKLKLKPITKSAMIFAKVGAAIFLERKRRAKDFLLDNNMMAFVPNDSLADPYMSVLFSKVRLSKFAQVGALPSYNGSDLATIPVHLPNDKEQKKIAAFLGAVDDKIGQLQTKKALLEEYKKGCMQKLFSRALRFKDDNGNDFPDWEEKRLGDIATFHKGKGISKSDIESDGRTPCVRYGELYTNYDTIIDEPVSRTNVPVGELSMSEGGEVIIPASGETAEDIATAATVLRSGIALGGDLNIIRSELDGYFLASYLSGSKRNALAKMAQGNSVVHIYPNHLRTLVLLIPNVTEQKKISNFLIALDTKIQLATTELEQALAFKKGLLQQMFV